MKVTADTNVLVRTLVNDDPAQAALARELLSQASLVAVALPVLCELVWVLKRVYGLDNAAIAQAIRALHGVAKMAMDRPAVEAGLALLEAGGDFADGVIAQQGQWLDAEEFVSFDKQAVAQLQQRGVSARLLS